MSEATLRVTRGNPTAEELATIIALVSETAARQAAEPQAVQPAQPDRWTRSMRLRSFPRDRWS